VAAPDNPFDPEPRGYRSPPGTYECILKAVLENPEFSDAEFRVLLYLATKPAGWIASERQIAEALQRPPERIRLALRGLRKHGYLVLENPSRTQGRFDRRPSVLRREMVLHPAQHQRVNHHPVVSYLYSEDCVDSDDGSVLLTEVPRNAEPGGTQPVPPVPLLIENPGIENPGPNEFDRLLGLIPA
jgi:hypothetical protein